ncbi:hypothetical protein GCM10020227_45440 [Streptomyces flavovirens]
MLSRSSESPAGLPERGRRAGRTAVPLQSQGPLPGHDTLRSHDSVQSHGPAAQAPQGAGSPVRAPARLPVPPPVSASTREGAHSNGLVRFNDWPRELAEAALLECCGSRRWAHRMAAHRPYPDLASLLAASDEAGYDLTPTDLAEALAAESAPCLHHAAPRAAHLALRAAHAAYEHSFGHVFVICMDGVPPSQHVDQVLAAIRARLANDPDEERSLTAEEMRRLARGRIVELVTEAGRPDPLP